MQDADADTSAAMWNHNSCGVSPEQQTQDFPAMQSFTQESVPTWHKSLCMDDFSLNPTDKCLAKSINIILKHWATKVIREIKH